MTDSPFGNMSVEVQPEALGHFSMKIFDIAAATTGKLSDSMKAIGNPGMGAAPVESSATTATTYATAVTQLGSFLKDVIDATAAFSSGAMTIAANYVISDDASMDEMTDVQAAFDTANVPVDQTVAGQQAAQDSAAQERIDNITPDTLPEPELPANTQMCMVNGLPPGDGEVEAAQKESQQYYTDSTDEDLDTRGGAAIDMSDVRASIDAPLAVQQEMAGTTPNDESIPVVDHDGNITSIPNPDYVPPKSYLGYTSETVVA